MDSIYMYINLIEREIDDDKRFLVSHVHYASINSLLVLVINNL